MKHPLTAWAETLVRGLARSGVGHVVVSPGSRSTPLVLAAERADVEVHTAIDERAAGFFALGQARVTQRPTALIATSGTAGAHYFPAVMEASAAGLPLVAVTADRPHELQACGAPQTTDQLSLFGRHVRAFFELGVPDSNPDALAAVGRMATQSVWAATSPDPGPVHINFRARKPLEPMPGVVPEVPRSSYSLPRCLPDPATIQDIAARCRQSRRGLIACGPQTDLTPEAAAALVKATGFPLVAEATSNLRFRRLSVPRLDGLDALLLSKSFFESARPDLVLEFGGPLTSSAWHRWMRRHRPDRVVVTSRARWFDPHNNAAHLAFCEPEALAQGLVESLDPSAQTDGSWRRASQKVWAGVERVLCQDRLLEGAAARAVVQALQDGDALMVANSLPVRHLDLWCPARDVEARVLSQRGVNGIDGLIAGAAGAASVWPGRVHLLIGDVAFAHDVGGLALARGQDNLSTVVLDNAGGRIFEQLPVADLGRPLDRFVTPPELSVKDAAQAFGMRYQRAETLDELRQALGQGGIVHAVVPPQAEKQVRQELTRWVEQNFKQEEKQGWQ